MLVFVVCKQLAELRNVLLVARYAFSDARRIIHAFKWQLVSQSNGHSFTLRQAINQSVRQTVRFRRLPAFNELRTQANKKVFITLGNSFINSYLKLVICIQIRITLVIFIFHKRVIVQIIIEMSKRKRRAALFNGYTRTRFLLVMHVCTLGWAKKKSIRNCNAPYGKSIWVSFPNMASIFFKIHKCIL